MGKLTHADAHTFFFLWKRNCPAFAYNFESRAVVKPLLCHMWHALFLYLHPFWGRKWRHSLNLNRFALTMTKTDREIKKNNQTTPSFFLSKSVSMSFEHISLCHLQLWVIMGKIREKGPGQGQSLEKRHSNNCLSKITSADKKDVKCKYDNTCHEVLKTTLSCYLSLQWLVNICKTVQTKRHFVCVW